MSEPYPRRPYLQPLFNLGQIVITPGALALLAENEDVNPGDLLRRHLTGDWGDMDEEDQATNDVAVVLGNRILSSYPVGDGKVWIITEWDRSVTTLLLPEDY